MPVMLREVSDLHVYPLTDQMLDAGPTPARIDGIVVGTLHGFSDAGQPLVAFPGRMPTPARSTVAITPEDEGRDVALMFEAGDASRPIIMGLIHHPVPIAEVKQDQKRIVLAAEEEIELRCGKSSITLTKAGKVIIRGDYLLSRSSGVNRIKGGSVQIN